MKAALLIVAGIAAMIVAAAPAAGGKSQGSAFLTDARAGYGQSAALSASRSRFVTDVRSGYGPVVERSAQYRFVTDVRGGYGRPVLAAAIGTPNTGFDWADAALGGGVTAGILMLLGGVTFVALRRRGRLAL
jgi:murein DD-endopeptidase MepM/ murein hydrolase activator NlpD